MRARARHHILATGPLLGILALALSPVAPAADQRIPNGVARAGHGTVTPVGTNVVVQPAPEVTLTFERVTRAGFTTARIVEFTDNRTGCYDQSLRDFFDPESKWHATLPDVNVPCYIQGFPKLDAHGNPTGASMFLLAVIDTTAKFVGPVDFHGNEEVRFGYQPACPNANLAQEPHTFYAPEPQKGEPVIEEELDFGDCPFDPVGGVCPIFTDISSQCGSNRGDAWNFSLYLTARDTRPKTDIVHRKFDVMGDTLERQSALVGDHALTGFLAHQISSARNSYDGFLSGGHPELRQASSQAMADFMGALYSHLDLLDHSGRNIGGELIGRARSARFFICKGSPDFGGCLALPPNHLP